MKTFKQFLFEGGNAITGVSRVPRDLVTPTVAEVGKRILDPLGIKWKLVGSAGKKEDSGDLDIVVDIKGIADPYEYLKNVLNKMLPGAQVVINKGFQVVSFAYPIVGGSGKAQIDFMPTDHMEFSNFIFTSDRYVTILVNRICQEVLPYAETDKPDGKYIKKFIYTTQTGLTLGIKFFRMAATGNIVTNGKYISKIACREPNKILQLLFGTNDMQILKSVESLMSFIVAGKAKYAKFDLNTFPDVDNKLSFTFYTREQIENIKAFVQTGLYI